MITYSIIQKSHLEGAYRLDAEYYQPEYLEVYHKLSACSKLIDVSKKITDFGAYSQMNFVQYSSSGVRFLRNQDVGEIFIDDSEPIFIPLETYEKLSLKLSEYDIITPRVGTLGNAAVVFKEFLPASANQNLAQIKPDISKVNPLYLAVFLCSYFGRKQFERYATGNVQPWLNLIQIKSLRVFLPSSDKQKTISDYVTRSLGEYENSKSLYYQAEDLLLEELGLNNFKPEEELSYIVNLSDVKSAHRTDAEYFQPKYDELIKRIAKNEHEKLIKLANRVKTKIKPIPDRLYKYIEISDIDISDGLAGFNEIIGQELPANASIPIKGLELVISKVRPTRGAISILPPDFNEDFICSGAFSVFTVSGALQEYLFAVLRSIIGKLQFEKPTTGTSYPTITDQDVENILVPILPQSFQQKIAELVRQSHEACKKSKDLLEKAKREVEEFIEKR